MSDKNDSYSTRLAALDVCAVSDTLDALSLPSAVTGLQRLSTDKRISGRVVTVELAEGIPEGGSKRHLCTGPIEAAQEGDVIVIQQSTGIDAAGWGGVLSTGASLAGIAGVIVEGPARDIDEARALEFPVYARSATARTARGRVYERDFNCPIKVGDVDVSPGDYVIADSSGVAFVPSAHVDEVLSLAERIAEKERLMVQDLHKGLAITKIMGTNYETMLE